MIKKFENYNSKFGVLMLYFDIKHWSNLIENMINYEDLYFAPDDDYGYEYEPHCTILYGFHHYKDIDKDISEFLPNSDINDIYRTDISIFDNDKYDVVKYDLISSELVKLNKIFKNNFKYTNEYFIYKPHMTISYVKKGLGKKYIKKIKPVKLKSLKYVYSDPNKQKTIIL